MRRMIITAPLIMLILIFGGRSQAGVEVGLAFDEDGLKSFHLAIGEHYDVPEKQVRVVRSRNIPDEELAVLFYIARRAAVSPDVVLKMRLGGKSWMEITTGFNLTAEIYYMSFDSDPGPPYGKAWGHKKKNKKQQWQTMHLADIDIVNFVNLRFITERHGYSVDEVIKMRRGGSGFVAINGKVKKMKGASKAKVKHASTANEKDKGKNKSKGKGKNK